MSVLSDLEVFLVEIGLSGCGCGLKSNCPLVGLETISGMPSVCVCVGGVFQRDPSPYLHEFRRKPRKNFEQLG